MLFKYIFLLAPGTIVPTSGFSGLAFCFSQIPSARNALARLSRELLARRAGEFIDIL